MTGLCKERYGCASNLRIKHKRVNKTEFGKRVVNCCYSSFLHGVVCVLLLPPRLYFFLVQVFVLGFVVVFVFIVSLQIDAGLRQDGVTLSLTCKQFGIY